MSRFRGLNGVEAPIQITGKVTYAAFDTVLPTPALFKVISGDVTTTDTVSVVLADGTTLTGNALLIDAMNCLVVKVNTADTTVLITEFGLFK